MRGKIRKSLSTSRPLYNPGEEVDIFSRASDYIGGSNNRFLFMNVLSAHDPYTFDEKQKEEFLPDYSVSQVEEFSTIPNIVDYYSGGDLTYENLDLKLSCYKASISYVDNLIKELYEDSSQNTVFIVLGDHGELFGEYELHGKPLIGHQLGTFKELIEVPCVIFSKSGIENSLNIDQDKVYDHRDIIGLIDNLTGGNTATGKESIRSEYYGLKGLQKYRIRDISDVGMKFAERKSFSYVDRDYKFDLASDGEFLWSVDEMTEETSLELDCISEEVRNKMQVLYQHNL